MSVVKNNRPGPRRDSAAMSGGEIRTWLFAALIGMFSSPVFATGSTDPSLLCEQAARIASGETGVPLNVLRALALMETGRQIPGGQPSLSPWPWATNQAGASSWFDTMDEAVLQVQGLLETGIGNVDLGCFQLNYRWHAAQFASVKDMFDPLQNARYAARMLARLYRDRGDWSLAAGAYHSGTANLAGRYRARFDANFAAVSGADVMTDPHLTLTRIAAPRQNLFPLLRVGGRGTGASLFPDTVAGRRLIGD